MSQDSATIARKPTPNAATRRAALRPPGARGGPRRVEAGDTLAHPGPKSAEADRVARRTSSTQTTQALAIGDLLASAARGQPPNDVLRQLQALIEGASPDEVKLLRKTLLRADLPPSPDTDPDTALSKGWRDGAYPYLNLLSRKSYERQKYRLQVELLKLQAWVKETGHRLFKFWFSVSRDEQRRRFKERRAHPLKQWKLSPVDVASLDKWDDYTRAKEAMFVHCDTSDAPRTVIKSDCKKRARLNAMRYLLHRAPYTNADRAGIGAVDPLIVGRPSLVSGTSDDQLAGTEA